MVPATLPYTACANAVRRPGRARRKTTARGSGDEAAQAHMTLFCGCGTGGDLRRSGGPAGIGSDTCVRILCLRPSGRQGRVRQFPMRRIVLPGGAVRTSAAVGDRPDRAARPGPRRAGRAARPRRARGSRAFDAGRRAACASSGTPGAACSSTWSAGDPRSSATRTAALEAWAYPLKLVDDFKLGFLLEGYPLEIDGPQIARWIDVRPEATTFTYSHAGFTVRQIDLRARGRARRSSCCSTCRASCP